MTAKKTMTKDEAKNWLKDKCFLTTQDNYKLAIAKMEEVGLTLWGSVSCEFPYIMMDDVDTEFLFLHEVFDSNEFPLSDLLSIEIVEDPDPYELLKEAVSLLRELYGVVAGGLSAPECHDLIRKKAENARQFLSKIKGV